jgi:hypothetical protein
MPFQADPEVTVENDIKGDQWHLYAWSMSGPVSFQATTGQTEFTAFVREQVGRDITIGSVQIEGMSAATGGELLYLGRWERSTDRLYMLQHGQSAAIGNLGTPAADGVNLSAVTFHFAVMGA